MSGVGNAPQARLSVAVMIDGRGGRHREPTAEDSGTGREQPPHRHDRH